MKTSASIKAYQDQKEKGTAKTMTNKIIEELKIGTRSTESLHISLEVPKSTITARISGLRALGLVVPVGETVFDNKKNTLWSLVNGKAAIESAKFGYNKERAEKTIKSLLNNHKEFLSPATRWHLENELKLAS